MKDDYVVYVPLKKSFEKLMGDHDNHVDATREHPPFDGTVRDVYDGSLWRTHPMQIAAVAAQTIVWMFMLYLDEVELCCPIGVFRGTHKYVFAYWVLLNLSAARRWKLHNVQVAFICTADTFVRHGAARIISGGMFLCLSVCLSV